MTNSATTEDDSPGRRRAETLKDILERSGNISKIQSIADYVSFIRKACRAWQDENTREDESDEEAILNTSRLVGQVWFRGHSDCELSLKPCLYREETSAHLRSHSNSGDSSGDRLFEDLLEIEHELRIDFTSYGHLLNESNQAKTSIDWYFLMQHHGVPTRLLDWTTNALAGLFFAIDAYATRCKDTKKGDAGKSTEPGQVAVWMVDAYWLADRLSPDWKAPILPYSTDAAKYVPPLDRILENNQDAQALVPKYPMPIEPPALHPRVAAQEGRFVIFGRNLDLLEEKIRQEADDKCRAKEFRLRQIRFEVKDIDEILAELAQLGISRRTLFPDLDGLAKFVRWKHFHRIQGGLPVAGS